MSKNTIKTLPKPDECPVCYEDIRQEKKSLVCGHWVHAKCIEKQIKNECPLCRHQLGPEKNTPKDFELLESEIVELFTSSFREIICDREQLPSWRQKGFLHPEEDEDYDEENPHGDSWDYDMY